ncbi:MAG: hypothetical protein M0Z45_02250 [Actinomycetota bacterium]|nr:hypothetical protein [Actinomycetota bacterium]
MKTLASLGLISAFLLLVVMAIAGFSQAWILIVVIAVFSLLFNVGPRRSKRS